MSTHEPEQLLLSLGILVPETGTWMRKDGEWQIRPSRREVIAERLATMGFDTEAEA
jgi:hypothetical protein